MLLHLLHTSQQIAQIAVLPILCLHPAGGGVTQIVMPYLTEGIEHHVPTFQAWRWAFFFPGCLQILWALMILTFGQVCQPCHITASFTAVLHPCFTLLHSQACCMHTCLSVPFRKLTCIQMNVHLPQ